MSSVEAKADKSPQQTPPATKLSAELKAAWMRVLPFALIFLASCSILFSHLGSYPLFNPDEALYAEPAREMLELKDYITTYLNYIVRYTKPPLVIWAQALSIIIFGDNEFAVRFFGAVCGALVIASVYWFCEKMLNRRCAVIASLSLATAPLFIGTAREAITDMPLSFFFSTAMLCFYLFINHLEEKDRQREKLAGTPLTLWLGYIFIGLAVMTKGPVGLILPVIILATYHILRGNIKSFLPQYKIIQGLLIVAAISLPWFVIELIVTKGAYFYEFIVQENFQRFTSVVDSHKGAWWYHIAAVFGGYFPWSIFFPQAIVSISTPLFSTFQRFWALCKSYLQIFSQAFLKSKKSSRTTDVLPWQQFLSQDKLSLSKDLTQQESLGIYCLCWFIVTLIFFSVSVSKLLPYTLPAFPALAIIVAVELEKMLISKRRQRAVIPLVFLVFIFAFINLFLPKILAHLREAPVELTSLLSSISCFELVVAIITCVFAARKLFRTAFFTFSVLTMLAVLFFGGKLITVLSNTWEEPLPKMAYYAAQSNWPIIVYDMRKPSVPFYTKRQVSLPTNSYQLSSQLKKVACAYILTKDKKQDFFNTIPGCKSIWKKGHFLLVSYRNPEKRTTF